MSVAPVPVSAILAISSNHNDNTISDKRDDDRNDTENKTGNDENDDSDEKILFSS